MTIGLFCNIYILLCFFPSIVKCKVSRVILHEFICNAHLNSLCENQCTPVLETVALALSNLLLTQSAIYTDILNKVIHLSIK